MIDQFVTVAAQMLAAPAEMSSDDPEPGRRARTERTPDQSWWSRTGEPVRDHFQAASAGRRC